MAVITLIGVTCACAVLLISIYQPLTASASQENELFESKEVEKCPRGANYYDGCNWCRCRNGLVACGRRGCTTIQIPKKRSIPQSKTTMCTSGEEEDVLFDGCNWCWCIDGVKHCTENSGCA